MNKKSIAILCIAALVTLMTGGVVGFYLFENAPEASIVVLSDTHIISESYFTSESIYQTYSNRDKMLHLSEAITKTIVDEIIRNKKIKTVLIPGDLTEAGDLASHLAAARIFQKLADSGKQVFVINGNHDSPDHNFGTRIPSGMFREIYYNFGYKQALVADDASLSYTADINEKYRLIAIDNDNYNSSDTLSYKEEVDDRLINWCEKQITDCKQEGKTPIIMAHKPFFNFFPEFVSKITKRDKSFDKIIDMFLRNGVNFALTGHNHIQSMKGIKKDENVFYDIGTCSAIYYPCAYRTIAFKKHEVVFDIVYTEKINMSYVHPFTSEEEYAKIENDFPLYAKEHCEKGVTFMNALSGNYIIDLLNLSGPLAELAALLVDEALLPLLTMPLYEKDALGGQSLQKIAKTQGVDLPVSDYTTARQLLTFFIMNVSRGSLSNTLDSVEIKLLNQVVYAFFYKFNELKDAIAAIVPDAPVLNLDIDRLYSNNELELFESNFLAFAVSLGGSSLPFQININKLTDLRTLNILIAPILNLVVEGLGDAAIEAIGSKEINLKSLLDNAVYGLLIIDFLNIEESNKVIINKETLKKSTY